MNLAKHDTKLCDLITSEPNIITVLSRFGITLGVGDMTIKAACTEHGIDCNLMLTIVNTFVNEQYFPENTLKSLRTSDIVSYMRKTNEYYLRFQIPNIERHFGLLLKQSDNSNNLQIILRFFIQLKEEMTEQIESDNNKLFPALLSGAASNPADNSATIEEKLGDLRNLFIMHLAGKFDINLCHAVILAIFNLEKDYKQNNRIRQRILIPMIKTV